jgi:ribonucleotide reductase alpha subunit
MDLWVREARLFKYGSGTGTNFSRLRGRGRAELSGGGKSSGLMSWLKIGDRAAGAIKSGGHDPPRREDGLPRPRPPRHREVRQLEGPRGD